MIVKPSEDRIKKALWWDRALSLVEGCDKVTSGCAHCWSLTASHMRSKRAGKLGERYQGLTKHVDRVQWTGEIRIMPGDLAKLDRIRKTGIVWSVWNDLFHPHVPLDFIKMAFDKMRKRPDDRFLILTKRPENIDLDLDFPGNVGIGVSASCQMDLIRNVDCLRYVGCAMKFVSLEPLLEPILLARYLDELDWVIAGCETGPGARPAERKWFERIAMDCTGSETPVFIKRVVTNSAHSSFREFPDW